MPTFDANEITTHINTHGAAVVTTNWAASYLPEHPEFVPLLSMFYMGYPCVLIGYRGPEDKHTLADYSAPECVCLTQESTDLIKRALLTLTHVGERVTEPLWRAMLPALDAILYAVNGPDKEAPPVN
mgnify:CR=1 FL=1